MSYAFEGPKWGSPTRGTSATITWSFADNNLTATLNDQLENYPTITGHISPDFRNVIRSAFDLWELITGITFIERADVASNDIRIGTKYIDGGGPTLGITQYWYSNGTFRDAVISLDDDAFASSQSLYSIALHEIGHAIGLGHSTSAADVMYPYLNSQNQGGLSIDDMTGARILYTTGLTLRGTTANDHLIGGPSSDLVFGLEGSDTVEGGEGNNIIVGGRDSSDGADLIFAGTGNDLIYGNGGNDTIQAGDGRNIAVGGYGDDVIILGGGNDIVYGNQGSDQIDAGNGQNLVIGGFGNDTIRSGSVADIIWGNEGDDVLTGGAGGDLFVFDVNSGDDRVTDFNVMEGDHLNLLAQTYNIQSAPNGDTIVVLSGGGSILLVGLPMASFAATFII